MAERLSNTVAATNFMNTFTAHIILRLDSADLGQPGEGREVVSVPLRAGSQWVPRKHG